MNIPFRQYHLFQILNSFEQQKYPLDLLLRNYFKEHRAVGSKDRTFIADTCYEMIRWRGLLDAYAKKPLTWQTRYEALIQNPFKENTLPPHIGVSFPKALFDFLEGHFGLEKTLSFCNISNTRAPLTLRVNTLKTTREALLEKWSSIHKVSPTEHSPIGIHFFEKINFFADPIFKEGLFEIQDEGSQLIALGMEVSAGQHILDYCAGAGGKSLAIAPLLEKKGQLYLYDIRTFALGEAKKRLKRAGIQNAQCLTTLSLKLKKRMDHVLVDAPCSGSGTYRRNPDMKWRWCFEDVLQFQSKQRHIFEKALSYVKVGGYITYATCSIFPDENSIQAEHFINSYPIEQVGDQFQSWPTKNGMDGFYFVRFQKKR
jgi:16S rRNA (cytosine967-C5)-methyltransferase